jgi:hypothetical protein
MITSPLTWLLFAASFAATCLIWRKIISTTGAWYTKAAHMIFVAVPFVGPMFYVFIAPPPKHPPDKQIPTFPKGTEVYPSFDPLITIIKKMFSVAKGTKK